MENKEEKVCILSRMKELYPDDIIIEWDDPYDTKNFTPRDALTPLSDSYRRFLWMIKDFKEYLVDRKCLIELPNDAPEKDCMVLYFDDDENLQHTGYIEEANGNESIVRSRWLIYKAVIKHKLWRVPPGYGTKVKFYKPLTTEQNEDYLCKFLINNIDYIIV